MLATGCAVGTLYGSVSERARALRATSEAPTEHERGAEAVPMIEQLEVEDCVRMSEGTRRLWLLEVV